MCDDIVGQVEIDTNTSEECESSSGLGDDVEVDDGVEDSGTDKHTESKESRGVGRVGEDVEKSKEEKGDDILNVILMSPSYSLYILIYSSLRKGIDNLVFVHYNLPSCLVLWHLQRI